MFVVAHRETNAERDGPLNDVGAANQKVTLQISSYRSGLAFCILKLVVDWEVSAPHEVLISISRQCVALTS